MDKDLCPHEPMRSEVGVARTKAAQEELTLRLGVKETGSQKLTIGERDLREKGLELSKGSDDESAFLVVA